MMRDQDTAHLALLEEAAHAAPLVGRTGVDHRRADAVDDAGRVDPRAEAAHADAFDLAVLDALDHGLRGVGAVVVADPRESG